MCCRGEREAEDDAQVEDVFTVHEEDLAAPRGVQHVA
jgi:hypothetical protein